MKLPTVIAQTARAHGKSESTLLCAIKAGCRLIIYDGLTLAAPMADIRDAVTLLKNSNKKDRRSIIASVNKALARNFPKVKSRRASQKVAMACAQDLAIWYANEIVEGRASEEVN